MRSREYRVFRPLNRVALRLNMSVCLLRNSLVLGCSVGCEALALISARARLHGKSALMTRTWSRESRRTRQRGIRTCFTVNVQIIHMCTRLSSSSRFLCQAGPQVN